MTDKISGNGQVPKIAFEGAQETPKAETAYSASGDKVIDNLDKAHSALVGRSMVKKADKTPKFDGRLVAGIKSDLKNLNADYEINKKAILLTDAAMKRGMSYEDAIKVGQEFIDMHKA